MRKPPFVKNNKLYLGKKQRGSSFLLGASKALPLLGQIIPKILGRRRKKNKRRKKEEKNGKT